MVDFGVSTGPNGDGRLSAGSIAGTGSYYLGANELTVGSNDLFSEVSGVISGTGGIGGSLVKIGSGTLTLSGANTYAGGTTVNGGTLKLGNAGGIGVILGTLTVGGAGTVDVFNADMSGITTISNAGSIYFRNGTSAPSATIANNGYLEFYNTSTAGSAGITNNGTLNFYDTGTAGSASITNGSGAALSFYNASTAGNANITNISSGLVQFRETSTAGSAAINNGGALYFFDTSTAGSATITNNGSLDFYNTGTAGDATINNNNALSFYDTSTAGSAAITNGSGAALSFYNASTAGSATITNNGFLTFYNASTAGNAALVNNAGGAVGFAYSGGPNGDGKLTAGSIEGAGNYILGANELTVGSNNLSTEVSGVISGAGGSLVKTGSGWLTLSGANTYTGGTTINGGTVQLGSTGLIGSILGAVTVGSGGTFEIVHADTRGITSITNAGLLNFRKTSTAGSATITNNLGGTLNFYHSSTGGSATITNEGYLSFFASSTAGNAAITNNTNLSFNDASTAGNATITNDNSLQFFNTSTAGNATITNNSILEFDNTSTAGSASIANGFRTYFNDTSTAGDATLVNNAGGTTYFIGNATAGNAQLINNAANAGFDFSGSAGPNGDHKLSAGSIAGNGTFNLGASELTAGGNNLSTTVSGVIADGGASGGAGASLVKTGTGTLTLTGTNTYAGGTTFAGGTVSVSSDANLGDAAGGLIFNGGALQISGTTFNTTARTINLGAGGGTFDIADAANNFILSQNLSGGALTKSGAGTLTLTGTESFSGATVSAGTLVFDANSTAGNAVITNNSQLTFATNATAGNATITNASQLNFYGYSTAGNAVIINSGNVLFDGDSTPDNAQLINTASTAVINFFTPGLNSDGKLSAGSIAGNGRFDLNSTELTVGSNNLSTTVTGVITGAGQFTGTSLIKVGTGTLNLAGINSYTGATIVDGGVLRVDGSIATSSSVTVNANAALMGTGTVSSTTINSGGALLGGNGAAGTSLAISGSLAFQSGAYYLVQVNPATASSVNVSGTATLGGATVNAVFASGSYVAKQYTILTAGSVSGTFGSLANSNLPSNFHTELSYDGTHAYLNLILNFVAPPGHGLSGNQQNVGNAIIDSFNRNGGISLVYSGLTSAGLTQASGETAAGSQQTTFQAMSQFMGLLTDPSSAGRETGASAPPAYADSTPPAAARDAFAMLPPAKTFEQRWNVWAAGFGGSQTTDGNTAQGSNSGTSRLFGTAAGAVYWFSPQTLAGFALAGGGTNFSVTGGGTGRSDLFQAGAYVRHTNGPSYISAALAYGWQDVTTDRTVTLAGVDRLRAEFNANAWSGRLEGGYRTIAPWIGGIGITPYAAGQFTTFNLPAYAESVVSGGGGFALSYAAKSVTDTRSELGLRADKSFAKANGILTLRGRAAWAHDFNPDHSVAATFQALPGASFVVNGARAASDSALTTASVEMKWLNGWSTAASFEGEFSNVTRSYAGKGTVRYAW
nr:autotransporter domain-containing protein [Bradyrhizobium sp. 139]